MEKELIEKEYKGYKLYFYNKVYFELGKNIIDKNIIITKELKVTLRNYVCQIKFHENKYILKAPRNEFRIKQRKFLTLFKKGEALSTLINLKQLESLNLYAKCYLAIVKRSAGFITDSYLVLENLEFETEVTINDESDILNLAHAIHSKRIYHGDFNMSNIIKTLDRLKLIDTQGKKYYFGKYRPNYDLLTLEYNMFCSYGQKNWYKKNIWYYLAYGMKKFKKLKFVDKIKRFKKKLRDKRG